MMSCDFVSGKLNWNTAMIDDDTLRTVKGKGRATKESMPEKDPKTGKFLKGKGKDLMGPSGSRNAKGEGISARGASWDPRGPAMRGTSRQRRPDKDTLDLTGLRNMPRSTQSSLDNLVSMMEAKEVVPDKAILPEVQTKAKGGRRKPIDKLDEIAMRYSAKPAGGRKNARKC